jgi:Cyclin, N-terminal domain/Cyclin, C-terminal domain
MVCNQEIIDTIKVMRMQEVTVYSVASDYLHQHQPQVDAMRGPINSKGLSVDADCRFKMAEWKRQVVDFCKFQRETVAISMSYLDRFLASPGGVDARHNRKIYQLASMAALYTAIKVNEPEAVDPKTVAGLSRGAHTEEQVEDMERQILFSIDWRLHPPTALAFCISFFAVLPEMEIDKRESIFALAKIQTELSVSDYFYVGVNPSTIAFAAIVNAIQSLDATVDVQALHSLAHVIGIDLSSKKFHEVQDKLYDAVVLTSPALVPAIVAVTNVLSKTIESSRASAGYVSPRGVNQQTTNC